MSYPPTANAATHWPVVRDKPAFLHRLMVELSGDTRISLEGNLSACQFSEEIVVSRDEVGILKRNTLIPRQDFLVLQLTLETVDSVFEQVESVGTKQAILHVQIERSGVLELGAYDNFHAECVVTGSGVSWELLEELKRKGVLRDFRVAKRIS